MEQEPARGVALATCSTESKMRKEEAWVRAWDKFIAIHKCEPDLYDENVTDRGEFLGMLTDEIRSEMHAEMAAAISAGAARIRAIDSDAPRAA